MIKQVVKPSMLRKRWFQLVAVATLAAIALVAGWTFWAEHNPDRERELRILIKDHLSDRFPEEMSLPEGRVGFVPRSQQFEDHDPPDVVLIHGLDEPGGIWDELGEAMDQAGINGWEFRYPNDQAIDRSADLLAEHWRELDPEQSIVLIGHSMGGLVIRDFVSRWRHPVDVPAAIGGPPVHGVVLVGTPNQGSQWARLRVWLELRDMLGDIPSGQFSLFAGLRDGTGVAKIDLRPESEFLSELNARAWPQAVPIRIIGGRLSEPTPAMVESMEALSEELGVSGISVDLETWWTQFGEGLGDGVVTIDSLALPEAPPPIVLPASHRGLLTRTPMTDDDPPAIAPVMAILENWDVH